MNKLIFLFAAVFLFSCSNEKRQWTFEKKMILDADIRPLGITSSKSGLWISDPDNSRVMNIDLAGKTLQAINNLTRPMHIEWSTDQLFIPDFSTDSISIYSGGSFSKLQVDKPLDAPSGVSTLNGITAIADFYNHRVLIIINDSVVQIGHKGHADGMLNYPTDVKLYKNKVIIADAYNNRIHIFDYEGNFLKVIGWKEDIKVAIGLDVFEDKIFVTDYYGNRLLVYDFEGNLLQIFEDKLNKPTDVLVTKDKLYVTNYGENAVSIYSFH